MKELREEQIRDTQIDFARVLSQKIAEHWNNPALDATADAIVDMLSRSPETIPSVLHLILSHDDYWMEQIARSILGWPSDDTGDLERLVNAFKDMEKNTALDSRHSVR